MARKIVITSGKGGVGKTTVAACLGLKLSLAGKRTAVIDLDIGLNNLDILLGVEGKTNFGVEDAICGRCRAKQALIEIRKNLYVMPSAKEPTRNVAAQNVKLLIEGLSSSFDFILVDSPAGVNAGFERAVASVDEAIVVVTPSLSSVRDADKAVSLIKSYGIEKTYAVVNRARGDLIAAGVTLSTPEIRELLGVEVIGVLPEDDLLLLGEARRVTERRGSNKAYTLTVKNLLGSSKRLYDPAAPFKGFFGRLKVNAAKRLR